MGGSCKFQVAASEAPEEVHVQIFKGVGHKLWEMVGCFRISWDRWQEFIGSPSEIPGGSDGSSSYKYETNGAWPRVPTPTNTMVHTPQDSTSKTHINISFMSSGNSNSTTFLLD